MKYVCPFPNVIVCTDAILSWRNKESMPGGRLPLFCCQSIHPLWFWNGQVLHPFRWAFEMPTTLLAYRKYRLDHRIATILRTVSFESNIDFQSDDSGRG